MTVMFDGYHKHHKRLLWLIESPFKSVSVACLYLLLEPCLLLLRKKAMCEASWLHSELLRKITRADIPRSVNCYAQAFCFPCFTTTMAEISLEKNMVSILHSIFNLPRGKSLLKLWVTLPLFFPTDSHPKYLSDLLQSYMSTSHTIRAHVQEVWDKSD